MKKWNRILPLYSVFSRVFEGDTLRRAKSVMSYRLDDVFDDCLNAVQDPIDDTLFDVVRDEVWGER